MKKVGFVALIGEANAGKSTFVNGLMGIKILAVSDKPQTTRENIRAIYNDEESQIIFVDTPGLHKPHGELGKIYIKDAKEALSDADAVIYVIDISHKPDEHTINNLVKSGKPLFVVLNKIDKLPSISVFEERKNLYKSYFKNVPDERIITIVATEKDIPSTFIPAIKSVLPEEEPYFPEDYLLDRPVEFVYSEFIKEKCMRLLRQEVPHAIHINILHVDKSEDLDEITADIIVEKSSERAIVVGKNGQMITKIRKYAENSIKGFTGRGCLLHLFVKVVPEWRNDERRLKEYGYKE